MKKILCFIFITIFLFSLTACTADLYQQMIIKGFGIDKDGDEYKITIRYASIDEDVPEKTFTVSGESVYDALNQISVNSGKKPLYSSASYIICSSEVAKEGLDQSLDFFVRYFKAKPVIKLYVTNESAEDIINAKKDDELIPSDVIQASTDNAENLGKTVSATVMSFIADTKSESKSSVVPVIKLEDEEYNCTGTAIFKDYKMLDILSYDETKAYLALSGDLANSSIVINSDNGEKITVEIQGIDSKIQTSIDENINISIDLCVKANLVAVPFESSQQSYTDLEEKISEIIFENANKFIKIIKAYSCDALGFANYIYKNNSEYWKDEAEKFFSEFKNIPININVSTEFIKTGEEDSPFYS